MSFLSCMLKKQAKKYIGCKYFDCKANRQNMFQLMFKTPKIYWWVKKVAVSFAHSSRKRLILKQTCDKHK